MTDKHLYTNGTDTFVSTSVEEAFKLYQDYYKEDAGDELIDWYQEQDDQKQRIHLEHYPEPNDVPFRIVPDEATVLEKGEWEWLYEATCKQWADACPLGFLCSTEW
jgi:hypothetical protein